MGAGPQVRVALLLLSWRRNPPWDVRTRAAMEEEESQVAS